jgi:hypothetical protein
MKPFVFPALVIAALLGTVPAQALAQAAHSQIDQPDSRDLRAFKAAIRKLYDLKERDFAEGRDDHILGRFYSRDAVSVGEGEGISTGREDFRKIYDEVTRQSTVKVQSVHTWVSGNAGWDWANFQVTPRNAAEKPFSFAILFLWAREHGRWICKGDAYAKGAFPVPSKP